MLYVVFLCLYNAHRVDCMLLPEMKTVTGFHLQLCPVSVQVAHVVDEVEYLNPGKDESSKGWAARQVATTADFSHNSFFWTHFSGGLNYQASFAARFASLHPTY